MARAADAMDRGERPRAAPPVRAADRRPDLRGPERLLLALQEQAGNRAVQRVVAGSPGRVVQRATGLAADVGGFVGGLAGVFGGWSAPGADANSRIKALGTAVNDRLGRVGIPTVVLGFGTDSAASATFFPDLWSLYLSAGVLRRPTLSDDQRAELADTVLHESRHAEQFFRVARLLCARERAADSHKGKGERRDDKTIAASVAQSLRMLPRVVETAQKQGGGLLPEEEAEANTWAGSIPDNAAVQSRLKVVISAWQKFHEDVGSFQRDYIDAPKRPDNPWMPVDGFAFRNRFTTLEAKFELTFAQYKGAYREYQLGLAFEADAWRTGRAAHAAVAGREPVDVDAKFAALRVSLDRVFTDWRTWLYKPPSRPHRDPATIKQSLQRHANPAGLEPLRDDVEPAS